MNEAQRSVLRNQHGNIVKHLILDNDILHFLLHKNVLTEGMLQTIQSKSTQHEKITELLSVLPKRGPKAFPIFLEAVRKHSTFLADKLEDDEKVQRSMFPLATITPVHPEPSDHAHPPALGETPTTATKHADHALEDTNNPQMVDIHLSAVNVNSMTTTPRETTTSREATTPRDPDKAFERNFMRTPQPKDQHSERRHSLSISSTNHAMTSNIIQQNLNTLYTKLKARLHSTNQREVTTFASAAEPATFKMVDKLTDDVFQALDDCEMTIAQCRAMMGGKDPNFPLLSHIINIQKSKKELEAELKMKDQQRNKYADHVSKLENKCRNQTIENSQLNEEVRKLRAQVEQLELVNSEREEKQKIIDELRKMVIDADTSKTSKLRSSYLALHYDSNSTEIKQLRAEVRTLKSDNENLRNENVLLKKNEQMRKLANFREDPKHSEHIPKQNEQSQLSQSQQLRNQSQSQSHLQSHDPKSQSLPIPKNDPNNDTTRDRGVNQGPGGRPKTAHPQDRSRQMHRSKDGNTAQQQQGDSGGQPGKRQANMNANMMRPELQDRQRGSRSMDRSTLRSLIDSQHMDTNINDAHESAVSNRGKCGKGGKAVAVDRSVEDLDFKFSNDMNGSLGQRRNPSRDRSNKRVTFLSDKALGGGASQSSVGAKEGDMSDSGNQTMVNGNCLLNGGASVKGVGAGADVIGSSGSMKQTVTSTGGSTRGTTAQVIRKKQSHLKNKSSTKRSASLNNITASRDLMKVSNQLIQKSRNLRHPTGH